VLRFSRAAPDSIARQPRRRPSGMATFADRRDPAAVNSREE
jgi:hypothetical protein